MDDSWESLSPALLPAVAAGVREFGFAKMTPVQAACIPRLLSHQDVAAEAVTGSGKTLAFLVPTLQIILRREDPIKKYEVYAIILSPSRELAAQIHEVLQVLLRHSKKVSTLLLVGGGDVSEDIAKFESDGGHIIVGTPGRVEDIFNRCESGGTSLKLACKALEVLILDEADLLLELGFTDTINTILAYLPKQRRTGLFSATQTSDVVNLIRAGLRNPVQIRVRQSNATQTDERTPTTLRNYYMLCEPDKKMSVLITLLRDRIKKKVLVFFASCAAVNYFSDIISGLIPKANVLSIHGKMKTRRKKVFEKFRQLKSGILICTDLMCRGVDIPSVDWVLQFDPPSKAESFVHRCGRTARSGLWGSALLMLLPQEEEYVKFIQINQRVKLDLMKTPKNPPDLLLKMRKIQLKDRAIMEKGAQAFVSFVKFYIKHDCNVLFKLKNINLGLLAMGYGLLKMPKMPELKYHSADDFVPYEMDFNEIAYKNKEREQSRQLKLKTFKETGKWPTKEIVKKKPIRTTIPWSKKKEALEKKKKNKSKSEGGAQSADLKDLLEDEKMWKNYKKKKISEEDMAKFLGCDNDGEKKSVSASKKG